MQSNKEKNLLKRVVKRIKTALEDSLGIFIYHEGYAYAYTRDSDAASLIDETVKVKDVEYSVQIEFAKQIEFTD